MVLPTLDRRPLARQLCGHPLDVRSHRHRGYRNSLVQVTLSAVHQTSAAVYLFPTISIRGGCTKLCSCAVAFLPDCYLLEAKTGSCWRRKPVLVAVLLGLLANVELHLAVISGGLAVAYCITQPRKERLKGSSSKHRIALGGLLLLIFYAFAIGTAFPPREMVHQFHTSTSFPTWVATSLVGGICSPWWLSIFFWIAIAFVLHTRRAWAYLIPVAFFAVFSGSVHIAFWHMGLLVPLLICFLWITWPVTQPERNKSEVAGRIALLALITSQILWSGHALAYDHSHPYSPDLETARFLRPYVEHGDTIAITYPTGMTYAALPRAPQADLFLSVGILPYFHHSIYVNEPYPFWPWKIEDKIANSFNSTLATRPRIVLVEVPRDSFAPVILNGPRAELLRKNGYRLTNIFCGAMPMRLGYGRRTCHVIFQRAAAPGSHR